MMFGRTSVSQTVVYFKNILKNNDFQVYRSIPKSGILQKYNKINNDFRSYQSIPKSGILEKHNEKIMIFGRTRVFQKVGYPKNKMTNNDFRSVQSIPNSGVFQKHSEKQ